MRLKINCPRNFWPREDVAAGVARKNRQIDHRQADRGLELGEARGKNERPTKVPPQEDLGTLPISTPSLAPSNLTDRELAARSQTQCIVNV